MTHWIKLKDTATVEIDNIHNDDSVQVVKISISDMFMKIEASFTADELHSFIGTLLHVQATNRKRSQK